MIESGASLEEKVLSKIFAHLESLSASFDNYFYPGELNAMEDWIIHHARFEADLVPDDEICKVGLRWF